MKQVHRIGAIAMAAVLAVSIASPVQAARLSETKMAVKVGTKCTKVNAKAKAGSVNLICKRVSGKLIWAKVKVSADCKDARAQYATQLKAYEDVLAQLNSAKAALADIKSSEADGLRTQVNALEGTVKTLAPVLKQFKTATDQICALS
jgi:hypothetical protein